MKNLALISSGLLLGLLLSSTVASAKAQLTKNCDWYPMLPDIEAKAADYIKANFKAAWIEDSLSVDCTGAEMEMPKCTATFETPDGTELALSEFYSHENEDYFNLMIPTVEQAYDDEGNPIGPAMCVTYSSGISIVNSDYHDSVYNGAGLGKISYVIEE